MLTAQRYAAYKSIFYVLIAVLSTVSLILGILAKNQLSFMSRVSLQTAAYLIVAGVTGSLLGWGLFYAARIEVRQIRQLLSEESTIAHWIYNDDEWLTFSTYETSLKSRSAKKEISISWDGILLGDDYYGFGAAAKIRAAVIPGAPPKPPLLTIHWMNTGNDGGMTYVKESKELVITVPSDQEHKAQDVVAILNRH